MREESLSVCSVLLSQSSTCIQLIPVDSTIKWMKWPSLETSASGRVAWPVHCWESLSYTLPRYHGRLSVFTDMMLPDSTVNQSQKPYPLGSEYLGSSWKATTNTSLFFFPLSSLAAAKTSNPRLGPQQSQILIGSQVLFQYLFPREGPLPVSLQAEFCEFSL